VASGTEDVAAGSRMAAGSVPEARADLSLESDAGAEAMRENHRELTNNMGEAPSGALPRAAQQEQEELKADAQVEQPPPDSRDTNGKPRGLFGWLM
jgi:hypothetical protein